MERTKNSNKNIKLQIKSFLKKISLQSWCACKRTRYVTSNDTLGLMLGWPTMLCPSKILRPFARGFRNCFPRSLTYHTRFTYLSK